MGALLCRLKIPATHIHHKNNVQGSAVTSRVWEGCKLSQPPHSTLSQNHLLLLLMLLVYKIANFALLSSIPNMVHPSNTSTAYLDAPKASALRLRMSEDNRQQLLCPRRHAAALRTPPPFTSPCCSAQCPRLNRL